MRKRFKKSHIGKLNYFLDLQTKQLENGIFISQQKYYKNLIKRFRVENMCSQPMSISTVVHLDKD